MVLEGKYAADLRGWIEMYLLEQGVAPKCWTNVMADPNFDYLLIRQKQFKQFPNPGFTKSIAEKYVFLSARITLPREEEVEVVMASAQPYFYQREAYRIVLFMRPNKSVGWVRMLESSFKKKLQNRAPG
jgi:hypothetical protein